MLGPLADNGGPTQTHAVLPGSPAIDAIPAGDCVVATDQRGIARPRDSGCDIGAFESLFGDADQDGDVDLGDYVQMMTCFSSNPESLTPACMAFDFDGDNDVDLADLIAFQAAFTGAR